MLNHHYTLYQIVRDLQQKLINTKIIECWTQEKDEVMFVFNDGGELYNLCVNLSDMEQAIYLRDKFARARANSKDLFPSILGGTIRKIDIADNDRTIFIRLNNKVIVINLGAKSEHNILILNNEHKIENTFYRQKELKHSDYVKRDNILPEANAENFKVVRRLLSNSNILLPRNYANDLLNKYSIDLNIESNTIDNLSDVIAEAMEIRKAALDSKQYYLYIYEDNTAILSLLPLSGEQPTPQIFTDIHLAITKRAGYQKRSEAINISKAGIIKKLAKIKAKIEKNIHLCSQGDELEQLIDNYKLYADVLMSVPNPMITSGNTIEMSDWEGNPISIPLDERLNLLDNSQRYYKKIKKLKTDLDKRKELLPKFQKRLDTINKVLNDIENINSIKEIKRYMSDITSKDKGMSKAINEGGEATKYREFELGEGYTLYVGRNAANNDELTMKFAKANDVWMHARGSSGSHTVLRGSESKEVKPPKNILKIAAQITAYYSKQKNAKYVPVAYTYKKYVHKPKGANLGAVVMSKEEVIMAEPKVPEGTD